MLPYIIMSLGISGVGLSFLSYISPYQQYFKFFAVASILYSHYRMAKGCVGRTTEITIWISTVLVIIILMGPLLIRIF